MQSRQLLIIIQQALLIFSMYILAYTIVAMLTGGMASRQAITGVLTPWGIWFTVSDAVWLQCNCVVEVYLAGPLGGFFLGGLIWFAYPIWKQGNNWLKVAIAILSIWLMVHLLMGWIAGTITGVGLGYVASWMYLPISFQWGIGLLLVVFAILIGTRLRRRLFRSIGYSIARIDDKAVRDDLLQYFGLPFLAAFLGVVLWFSWRPHLLLHAVLIFIGGVLLLLPMWWAKQYLVIHAHRFPEKDVHGIAITPIAWLLPIGIIIGVASLLFL